MYLYLRVFVYGLVEGDSYIWQLTPWVAINNYIWYGLWSLNLPKMLVDYVSFDGQVNPNLWQFWRQEIIPIFALFSIQLLMLTGMLIGVWKKLKKSDWLLLIFSLVWFGLYLLPIIFLQWHKFTTYLTIPLIGMVMVIGLLLSKNYDSLKTQKQDNWANILIFSFLIISTALSFLTLKITKQTDWISQGAQTAKKVYQYIDDNYPKSKNLNVVFYDNPEDEQLPWLPSQQLKVILSDQNFWLSFYDDQIKAQYLTADEIVTSEAQIKIPARQFLGY